MDYSAEIKSTLINQLQNGGSFWSREDGDIHAPHGSSTIDTMEVLGELGVNINTYPEIIEAIDFIFEYQTSDGSFKYSKTSSILPCMTARIIAALGRLGAAKDNRTEKSYQQLLTSQWKDGGWRCNTVKFGKSESTDASNPGTTLYVLDAFRFRKNRPKEIAKLNKGIDFLLSHWETRKPLGPCTFGIGNRFLKVEFPFLRYNIFYYVYTLSFYSYAKYDSRFREAFLTLSEKTENDDIILENPHRAWRQYNFAKKGLNNSLATERWKEIKFNLKRK